MEQLDTVQVGNGTPPGLDRDTVDHAPVRNAPAVPRVTEPVRAVADRQAVSL